MNRKLGIGIIDANKPIGSVIRCPDIEGIGIIWVISPDGYPKTGIAV